jgi:hypothetical protein
MLLLCFLIQFLLAFASNMFRVVVLLDSGFTGRVVIGFIQAKMLGILRCWLGTFNHYRFNRGLQQLSINLVGWGNNDG